MDCMVCTRRLLSLGHGLTQRLPPMEGQRFARCNILDGQCFVHCNILEWQFFAHCNILPSVTFCSWFSWRRKLSAFLPAEQGETLLLFLLLKHAIIIFWMILGIWGNCLKFTLDYKGSLQIESLENFVPTRSTPPPRKLGHPKLKKKWCFFLHFRLF